MRYHKFAVVALTLLIGAFTPGASQAIPSFSIGESNVKLEPQEDGSISFTFDDGVFTGEGSVIPFDSPTLWQLVFIGSITNNSTVEATTTFTFSSGDFDPKPPGEYPNALLVFGSFQDPGVTGDATGDSINDASATAQNFVELGPLSFTGDAANNFFDLFTIVSGPCGFADDIGYEVSACNPFLSATVTLTLAAGHSAHFPITVQQGPDVAVPEPSTLLLLASGMVGVVAFGRKAL